MTGFVSIYLKDYEVTCARMTQPVNAWLLELSQNRPLIRETKGPFYWTAGSIKTELLLLHLLSYLGGRII